jgi:rubredoxin
MKIVELKTAYHWNCDACGADNFDVPQKAELTEEDREQAYREIHELGEWEDLPENWREFELVTLPDQVTCEQCGETYFTRDERDAGPQED